MQTIFISYRRADSQLSCDRINAFLGSVFGVKRVFRDLNTIPGGVDFRKTIEKALKSCGVMLVLIGPQWLAIDDGEGHRRLDDSNDLVRLEIEAALSRRIPVLPLLVQGASLPSVQDLPDSLRQLVLQNVRQVRADPDFARDMQVIMQDVSQFVPIARQRHGWRVVRNMARTAVGFAVSLVALLLFVGALASWVNVPLLTDLVTRWFGR